MRFFRLATVAFGLAGVVSTAAADLTITGDLTVLASALGFGPDGGDFWITEQRPANTWNEAFGPVPQTFQWSHSSAGGPVDPFGVIQYQGQVNTVASPTEFSVAWDITATASYTGITPGSFIGGSFDIALQAVRISVDAPTTLRISYDGAASFAGEGLDPLRPQFTSSVAFEVSSSGGVIAPFNAGFGRSEPQISAPFTFDIEVPASEEIFLRLRQNFYQDPTGASNLLNGIGWNEFQRASLSIRVVGDCIADFNNSGEASVQDIFDFLAAYFANDPASDINSSGVISVQDIFDFLAAYFEGC